MSGNINSQIQLHKGVTFKDTDSLSRYFKEIRDINPLSKEEETDLSIRIKEGDEQALNKLVRANLKFVILVAKAHQGRGVALVDLINEGNLGLIKAARKFDHTKGFKFISYAVWWCRQAIYNSVFLNTRVIRLPNNKSSNITKINGVIGILEQELEREPSWEEISDRSGIPVAEVKDTLISFFSVNSMDDITPGEDSLRLGDTISDPNNFEDDQDNESLHDDIIRTMSCLTQKEIDCILLSFGIICRKHTTFEISSIVGVNHSRIWHLINRGQMKMKENDKLLKHHA